MQLGLTATGTPMPGVTCHAAEVTFPPLPSRSDLWFSDPGGLQGWVDLFRHTRQCSHVMLVGVMLIGYYMLLIGCWVLMVKIWHEELSYPLQSFGESRKGWAISAVGSFIGLSAFFLWVLALAVAQCLYLCLSVLWRCWLGGRKGIRPVKNWVVGWWHGYLSGVRCRLAHGPADATATHCLLFQWNPDRFYLSGTGWPGKSRKKGR